MARASETDSRELNFESSAILTSIRSFLENKAVSETATTEMKKVQPQIVEWLQETVDPDADGNHEFPLEEPVAGFARLKLVRVVKNGTDLEAVERIAKEKNLPQCLKLVAVPDEDEIAQAALRGEITDEEMAEMFPQSVSYRLMTPKK